MSCLDIIVIYKIGKLGKRIWNHFYNGFLACIITAEKTHAVEDN